jgi:cyclophilin family peptidyl-prolyl cis-trans isomerase
MIGCGKPTAPPAEPTESPSVSTSRSTTASSEPASTQTSSTAKPAFDPLLHAPFVEATTSEAPPDWHRPPDTTLAGKSVGKLYTEVVKTWDDIRFTDAAGNPLDYEAIVETELGTITIALRPDWSPNHVRSFIALARVGYYDGLVFDRVVKAALPDDPDQKLELIQGGCPLGTGEMGYGSIGYWVYPEIHPDAHHDEGAVGAYHGVEASVGACKFYINLCKAPFMDGHYSLFGKVTAGLDVARAILARPNANDDEERPETPVVIHRVQIREKPGR